ncbi:hypothetical protein ONZ45_g19223 [Pleurotus djamor]|nr:hypothetical protein ONZ45_g19223 [Pleurotus djamor]
MFSARFQSFAKAFSRSACRSLSTQSARSASLQFSRFASKPVSVFSVPARSFLTSSIARDDSRNYARRQPSEPSEPSDTLFIANLPFIAEEDDVRLAFEKYGPIEQVRVSVGHDGRSRGSALITFGSNEAASSAMEASNESPIYIFDRPTRVEFARSRPGRAPAPPSERLYVRDWQGGENELRAIFGDFEDSIDHIYFGTQ